MAKIAHVIFEAQQIGDEWQLRLHCPEGKIDYVKGFKSKAEAEKWRETAECQNWRARWGYLA
jgi:hypothetical protein